MNIKMKRMWINQPSALQKHHKLHGMNVLAHLIENMVVTIWFIKGDVISQQIDRNVLEYGWLKENK